ncbi:hypothetical protein KGF57_000087 [Candida theae]|uniref:Uncharacterized protein n=1 Tax=Candida theae TaxID=1198502 RepID=A0AAD5G0Y4_9ASCO|nr:uncharacterized protein KGF57_000087 [Candida theae]KAI5968627.1 hypothetical protein KGF57_000087 [Candida theae]
MGAAQCFQLPYTVYSSLLAAPVAVTVAAVVTWPSRDTGVLLLVFWHRKCAAYQTHSDFKSGYEFTITRVRQTQSPRSQAGLFPMTAKHGQDFSPTQSRSGNKPVTQYWAAKTWLWLKQPNTNKAESSTK